MNDHSTARAAGDEPQTPMWLPALGAALFVALGIAWTAAAATTPRTDDGVHPPSAGSSATGGAAIARPAPAGHE